MFFYPVYVCPPPTRGVPPSYEATTNKKRRNLYKILRKAISELYGQNVCSKVVLSPLEMASRIAKLEQLLEEWKSHLPPSLSIQGEHNSAPEIDETAQLGLKIVLALRYHTVRNLVHRPSLERFLVQTSPTCQTDEVIETELRLLITFSQHSLQVTMNSSAAIVSLLKNLGHCTTLPGPWWFHMYSGMSSLSISRSNYQLNRYT